MPSRDKLQELQEEAISYYLQYIEDGVEITNAIEKIADKFDKSERTVYRWLKDAGISTKTPIKKKRATKKQLKADTKIILQKNIDKELSDEFFGLITTPEVEQRVKFILEQPKGKEYLLSLFDKDLKRAMKKMILGDLYEETKTIREGKDPYAPQITKEDEIEDIKLEADLKAQKLRNKTYDIGIELFGGDEDSEIPLKESENKNLYYDDDWIELEKEYEAIKELAPTISTKMRNKLVDDYKTKLKLTLFPKIEKEYHQKIKQTSPPIENNENDEELKEKYIDEYLDSLTPESLLQLSKEIDNMG